MDTLDDDDLRRIWVKHSADDVVTTLQQFVAVMNQAKTSIEDIDDADECLADLYRLRASARRLLVRYRSARQPRTESNRSPTATIGGIPPRHWRFVKET